MVGLIGLYPWNDSEPGDMVGLLGLYPWNDTRRYGGPDRFISLG